MALKMKELGRQTQQGYIRMRYVHSMEIVTPEDGYCPPPSPSPSPPLPLTGHRLLPYVAVTTDDRLWSFAPDDQKLLNYWFDALLVALEPFQPIETTP
jgi:hypothetical protein